MKTQHHKLSLTGPNSHTIRREAGVGNLYIGPNKQPKNVPQAIVDPDQKLQWTALDVLPPVPAGYPWPRWIHYEGNDASFLNWAEHRSIERFIWKPTHDVVVDASRARILQLSVRLGNTTLNIQLPKELRFAIEGRLSSVIPSHTMKGDGVKLAFIDVGYRQEIPLYDGLANTQALSISSRNAPLDIGAIAGYTRSEMLSLSGPLQSTAPLSQMRSLRKIELRRVWNLAGFPSFDSWPHLEQFFAVDIPKEEGLRLKERAKKLDGVEVTIRGLRTSEWIAQNAESPFRGWHRGMVKPAHAAFLSANDKLKNVTSAEAVRAAIHNFTDELNTIHGTFGLMTMEREDAGYAVELLIRASGRDELAEEAQAWFDERRNF